VVTIFADVRVPTDAFLLGQSLMQRPELEVEIERLVPAESAIVPLFWVRPPDDAVATLRADPTVEALEELVRTPDSCLYAARWQPAAEGLVRTLVELDVVVVSGVGQDGTWSFRLQFPNRSSLQRFRRSCLEQHVQLELLELFNPQAPPEPTPLSSAEHDALATAYENGYWDVPRGTTQGELATLIGLSETALSHHLRNGVKQCVDRYLYGPGGYPFA